MSRNSKDSVHAPLQRLRNNLVACPAPTQSTTPYNTASKLPTHGWTSCNHFKYKTRTDAKSCVNCAYTTWTIPPHPLMQSRSTDDNSACEITSNSSSGPFSQKCTPHCHNPTSKNRPYEDKKGNLPAR
jgi:hypothetical protein